MDFHLSKCDIIKKKNKGGYAFIYSYPTTSADFALINVRAEVGETADFVLREYHCL